MKYFVSYVCENGNIGHFVMVRSKPVCDWEDILEMVESLDNKSKTIITNWRRMEEPE